MAISRIWLKGLVGLPGFEPGTSCTPNSSGKIAQEVCFQLLTGQRHTRKGIEDCRELLPFAALGHYIIIYIQTACLFIYKRRAITGNRSVGGSVSQAVTKSEFERRAAEMRARNLVRPRFRNLSPPRSIFAPPRATPVPAKVYVRDFLREVDIKHLSAPLAAIKKLDKLETDRDGLLDLKQADLQISVSPDLLQRGIKAYDAVLRAAAERGWPLKIIEGVVLRIMISGEPLELAVTEKTEPIAEVKVRPGERRPRRPTGALVVSLTAGYRKVMVSDKRGTRVESKFPGLFANAEALAAEVHAEHERDAAMRWQEEIESATPRRTRKANRNGWTGTSAARGVVLRASAHAFRRCLIGWQRRG